MSHAAYNTNRYKLSLGSLNCLIFSLYKHFVLYLMIPNQANLIHSVNSIAYRPRLFPELRFNVNYSLTLLTNYTLLYQSLTEKKPCKCRIENPMGHLALYQLLTKLIWTFQQASILFIKYPQLREGSFHKDSITSYRDLCLYSQIHVNESDDSDEFEPYYVQMYRLDTGHNYWTIYSN